MLYEPLGSLCRLGKESTAQGAQKVHLGCGFEPVLRKSGGRRGYKMRVGFTLLLALEDLQGGAGQHPQPLASGFDDKVGRGWATVKYRGICGPSQASFQKTQERHLFWTLGLPWSLLPASNGCLKPGKLGKLSIEEAEPPKTMGDSLRAAVSWTGLWVILWRFRCLNRGSRLV